MKFETLLKMLAASKSDELHIEPDEQPYFITANGKKTASDLVLTAATISSMIFPAIPVEEKMRLPNVHKISFNLINEAGEFKITVAKSATGLNVTVNQISAGLVESLPTTFVDEVAPPTAEVTNGNNAVRTATLVNSTLTATLVEEKETASPTDAAKPKSFFSSLQSAFSSNSKIKESPQTPIATAEEAAFPTATPVSTENKFAPKITLPEIENPPPVKNNFVPPVKTYDSPIEVIHEQNIGSGVDLELKQKMDTLFRQMAEMKSSDLHMSVSMPPMVRKDGKMQTLGSAHETLSAEAMRELLWSIMPEKNREEFERRHDTDFAYEIPGLARFRANIFMDRKGMGGVFRIIPTKILTAEQLGLSQAILDLCNLSKGLVVVTGPTGSGKSTTLCAMVDYINKSREDHIITIEDPIEFVHENQKCLVNQREVHNHTDSFKDALRAALREDPDILLVGEMRDLETISIAIETAETGHLVFGTLHTTTAPSTVDRIIDQFPADRQQQIRVMLSESLKGVIAQTLLPKKGGGRVAALEVLIVTPAISNLIREGKTFQIASSMQTGKTHGMVVLNDALIDLVKNGMVEPRDAYIKAVDKMGFEMLLKRHGLSM